eukprot:Ihof_evm2s320 gene=Ihof_evmTU2s320
MDSPQLLAQLPLEEGDKHVLKTHPHILSALCVYVDGRVMKYEEEAQRYQEEVTNWEVNAQCLEVRLNELESTNQELNSELERSNELRRSEVLGLTTDLNLLKERLQETNGLETLIKQHDQQVRNIQSSISDLEEMNRNQRKELERLQADLQISRQTITAKNEAIEANQLELTTLRNEITKGKSDNLQLQLEMSRHQSEALQHQTRNEWMNKQIQEQNSDLIKERGEHTAEIKRMANETQRLDLECRSLNSRLEAANKENEDLYENLEECRQETLKTKQRLESEVLHQTQAVAVANQELSIAKSQGDRLRQQLEMAEEDLQDLQQVLMETRAQGAIQLETFQREQETLMDEKEELEMKVNDLTNELSAVEDALKANLIQEDKTLALDEAAAQAMTEEAICLSTLYVKRTGAEKLAESYRLKYEEKDKDYEALKKEFENIKPIWIGWKREREEFKKMYERESALHKETTNQLVSLESELARANLNNATLRDQLEHKDRIYEQVTREIADRRQGVAGLLLRIEELQGRPSTNRRVDDHPQAIRNIATLLEQNQTMKNEIKSLNEQMEMLYGPGAIIPANQMRELESDLIKLRNERERQTKSYNQLHENFKAISHLYAEAVGSSKVNQAMPLALPSPPVRQGSVGGDDSLDILSNKNHPTSSNSMMIGELNRQIGALEAQLQQAKEDVSLAEDRLARSQSDAKTVDVARAEALQLATDRQMEIIQLSAQAKSLQSQLEQLQKELQAQHTLRTAIENQCHVFQSKCEKLGEHLANANHSLSLAEEVKKNDDATMVKKDQQVSLLQNDIVQLKTDLREITERETTLKQEHLEMVKEKEMIQATVDGKCALLRAEIDRLQHQLTSEKERLKTSESRQSDLEDQLRRVQRESQIALDAFNNRLANEGNLRLQAENKHTLSESQLVITRQQQLNTQSLLDNLKEIMGTMAGIQSNKETLSVRSLQQQLANKEQEIKELDCKLEGKNTEIRNLESRMVEMESYSSAFNQSHDTYKAAKESEVKDLEMKVQDMLNQINDLTSEKTDLLAAKNDLEANALTCATEWKELETSLRREIDHHIKNTEALQTRLDEVMQDALTRTTELQSLTERHELDLTAHANDLAALSVVRESLANKKEEYAAIKLQYAKSQQEISVAEERHEVALKQLQETIDQQAAMVADLTRQNELLHCQLDTSTRTAMFATTSSTNMIGGKSSIEEEGEGTESVEGMREIVRFVRSQNDAMMANEVRLKQDLSKLREECKQLQSQLDNAQRELDTLRIGPKVIQGAGDYNDLMVKLQEMSVLRESNRKLCIDLRRLTSEMDQLKLKNEEYITLLANKTSQVISGQEREDKILSDVEGFKSQVLFLEGQVKRLRQSQTNPDVHLKLQQEKDELESSKKTLEQEYGFTQQQLQLLQQKNANLTQDTIRLAQSKNSLEKEKIAMEAILAKTKEDAEIRNKETHKKIEILQGQCETTKQKIALFENAAKQANNMREKQQGMLEAERQLVKQMREKVTSLEDTAIKEQSRLQGEIDALTNEKTRLEEKVKANQITIEDLTNKIKALPSTQEPVNQSQPATTVPPTGVSTQKRLTHEDAVRLVHKVKGLGSEKQGLLQQISELKAKVADQEKQLCEVKGRQPSPSTSTNQPPRVTAQATRTPQLRRHSSSIRPLTSLSTINHTQQLPSPGPSQGPMGIAPSPLSSNSIGVDVVDKRNKNETEKDSHPPPAPCPSEPILSTMKPTTIVTPTSTSTSIPLPTGQNPPIAETTCDVTPVKRPTEGDEMNDSITTSQSDTTKRQRMEAPTNISDIPSNIPSTPSLPPPSIPPQTPIKEPQSTPTLHSSDGNLDAMRALLLADMKAKKESVSPLPKPIATPIAPISSTVSTQLNASAIPAAQTPLAGQMGQSIASKPSEEERRNQRSKRFGGGTNIDDNKATSLDNTQGDKPIEPEDGEVMMSQPARIGQALPRNSTLRINRDAVTVPPTQPSNQMSPPPALPPNQTPLLNPHLGPSEPRPT